MKNWINLNPATIWKSDSGKLVGFWQNGGSTLWNKMEFSGDLLIEFHGNYFHRITAGHHLNCKKEEKI